MNVCMHACMYVYVCTFECMYVCTFVRLRACMHAYGFDKLMQFSSSGNSDQLYVCTLHANMHTAVLQRSR